MPADPVVRHPQERSRLCRDSVRVYAVACCCFAAGPAVGAFVGAWLGGGTKRPANDPGFDPERRIPGVHWLFDRLPRTQWVFWTSLAGVAAAAPLIAIAPELVSQPFSRWQSYPNAFVLLLFEFPPIYAILAWILACLRLKWGWAQAVVPADFRALHRTLGGSLFGTLLGWELIQLNSTMQLFVETRVSILPRYFHADWSVAFVCCRWCCQLCTLAGLLGTLVVGSWPGSRARVEIGLESPAPHVAGLVPGWPRMPRVWANSLFWIWAASVPLIALLAGLGERSEPLLIVGESLQDHQTQAAFQVGPTIPKDPVFLHHCPGCGNPHPDRWPRKAQVALLLLAPVQVVAAWMWARWRLARRRAPLASPEELRTVNRVLGWSLLGMLLGMRWMQMLLSLFIPWR